MSLLCLLQSNISVLVFWRYDNSNRDNYGGDNIIDGDKDTNGNGDSDNDTMTYWSQWYWCRVKDRTGEMLWKRWCRWWWRWWYGYGEDGHAHNDGGGEYNDDEDNDVHQEDTDLSSGLGWPDPTLTGEIRHTLRISVLLSWRWRILLLYHTSDIC